jgi:hydrogenase maturation protease
MTGSFKRNLSGACTHLRHINELGPSSIRNQSHFMEKKVALIGIGNILLRDEGVGVHAIKAVQERCETPPQLLIVDGGTTGLDLLPYLEESDRVLFVDAVNFGQEPGFIGVLEGREVPALFGSKVSLHHLGLADVLAAAQLLEVAPREICLIGMQPQAMEPGLELTEVAQEKLELLVARILAKLQDWGLPCTRRAP